MVAITRTSLGPTQFRPQKRPLSTTIDVSYLRLDRGRYITIITGDNRSVEVVCKQDGTLQVCVDDATFEGGVHRFEDIYGPDPFKDEAE